MHTLVHNCYTQHRMKHTAVMTIFNLYLQTTNIAQMLSKRGSDRNCGIYSNMRGIQKVFLSLTYLKQKRDGWEHIFFNIITGIVRAQCVAISEFFDACKIVKFWLLLQTLLTWHQVITISSQLNIISDKQQTITHTHTHIHLTALFPGLPRWAGTRKVESIWILLKQETVSGS